LASCNGFLTVACCQMPVAYLHHSRCALPVHRTQTAERAQTHPRIHCPSCMQAYATTLWVRGGSGSVEGKTEKHCLAFFFPTANQYGEMQQSCVWFSQADTGRQMERMRDQLPFPKRSGRERGERHELIWDQRYSLDPIRQTPQVHRAVVSFRPELPVAGFGSRVL
jgi:hypothetical protein